MFFTIALNSEAQYKLLTRGQPSPYDTAVAVEIHRFRLEGQKLKVGSALIDSLNRELFFMQGQLVFAARIRDIDSLQIESLERSSARKDSLNQVLVKSINAIPTADPKFWTKDKIGVGVLVLLNLLLLFK